MSIYTLMYAGTIHGETLFADVSRQISTPLVSLQKTEDGISFTFVSYLTDVQLALLQGILGAHTGAPPAPNLVSPEQFHRNEYERLGLGRRTIESANRKGEVARYEYFIADTTHPAYEQTAISEDFSYQRNADDLPTSCLTTVTYYRNDGTVGTTQSSTLTFSEPEGFRVNLGQRERVLDMFCAAALSEISGTAAGGFPNSVEFLADAETGGYMALYRLGASEPMIEWVEEAEYSYLTSNIKQTLVDILKGPAMATISLLPRSYLVQLLRGDDYHATDGRAVEFVKDGQSWPDLTGATIEMGTAFGGNPLKTFVGTVVVPTGDSASVRFEFDHEDTIDLPVGTLSFDIQATLADSRIVTLARGTLELLADVTLSPTQIAPDAPTELTATALSDSEIELSWTDNSLNENGFKIERRSGTAPFVQIGQTVADTVVFTDEELDPETLYTYRVRAFNAVATSPYSNEASAETQAEA